MSEPSTTAPVISRKQYTISLLAMCIVLSLFAFQPYIDMQLSSMLTVTLSVYAIARGLNAAISVAQSTELAATPAGVGVSFNPGEILDPLNDLIEQFSLVLLVASASLGIQQIVVSIGDITVLRVIIAVIALLAVCLTWFKPEYAFNKQLVKLVLILTVLRCVVPVAGLTSNALNDWIEAERQQAVLQLESTRKTVNILKGVKQSTLEIEVEGSSWFNDIITDIKQKIDIRPNVEAIKNKAEGAVEATVFLISQFVLQYLLLPIIFLWLMVMILRRIMSI